LKLADEEAAFSASPSHGNEKCRFWPECEEGFVEGGEFGFLAACDYPKIRSRNIIRIISTTDLLNSKQKKKEKRARAMSHLLQYFSICALGAFCGQNLFACI
jgi:hypothetical protein